MRLTLCSVLAGMSLWTVLGAQAYAANIPYSAWQGDEFTANAALSNLNSNSPVFGNGDNLSAENNAIYATFNQVDLNVGDKITFSGSFVVEGTDTISAGTGALRIGLFNDITTTDEDPNAVPNTGWVGYYARTVSTSGNTVWLGRTSTTTEAPLGGTGVAGLGASTAGTGEFVNGGVYTFELTIQRTADDILLSASFGGGYSVSALSVPVSGTPSVLPTTSFDRVGIFSTGSWPGTNPNLLSFSDLTVTYTAIPEPHSVALLSLGLCSLGWVTFKKRRISG